MPTYNIDGIEFNSEDLSEPQKVKLNALLYSDQQIKKLKDDIAIFKSARDTYLAILKQEVSLLSDDF
jgi:hypothetical protein